MKDRKVMIATPCYDGRTTAGFTLSLTGSMFLAYENGIRCKWAVQRGIPYLPVARNKLVREFLGSDAEELVFIDSDVTWDPDAFLRLMSWDVDFVAGVYPYKTRNEAYPVKFMFDEKSMLIQDKKTNLLKCEFVPTGFMRLKRSVLEKMISEIGHDELEIVEKDKQGREKERYLCLFDTVKHDGQWIGEDVNFCRLWRDMGGEIFVDPEMNFWHTGSYDYQGNLGDYLRKEMDKQKSENQSGIIVAA